VVLREMGLDWSSSSSNLVACKAALKVLREQVQLEVDLGWINSSNSSSSHS